MTQIFLYDYPLKAVPVCSALESYFLSNSLCLDKGDHLSKLLKLSGNYLQLLLLILTTRFQNLRVHL